LSVKVRFALRVPLAVGVKATPTVQHPLGASVVPQVFETIGRKSPAFAPATVIPEIVIVAVPLLVISTSCVVEVVETGTEPNSTPVGVKVVAACVPVPVTAADCGLPAALSVTESEELAAPVAVGVKVMLTWQVALAARVDPQVFPVMTNTVPATVVELMERVAVPLFVSVKVPAAEGVPTS
jgi:hypothetical protein